jgi:putative aldouronate transport system permease protein
MSTATGEHRGSAVAESGTASLSATGATGATGAPGAVRRSRRRWYVRLRRDRALLIMCLPALVLLGVFGYAPMLGLVMAFQDYDLYDGILHSPWVGLANFQQLFTDPGFLHAFWNTLMLFSVQLVLFFPVPIALAILLDTLLSRRLRALVQAVVTLPHFFSFVLVVTIFNQVFGGAGVLDTYLRSHGVTSPFDFHDRPRHVQVPGHLPAHLEGSRLVDDRLPGGPGRDQPVAARGRGG